MLRRYPALVFMLAAGALAILLPSALNVPQSGPSTLAEFAPVPGAGEGRSDISDLGSGSSGGLGFGGGSGSQTGVPPGSLGAPDQKRPQLKRCVGNPPRQTEDPLSPPCVAFFNGDNFGATSRGVTRDEVTVVHVVETGSNVQTSGFVDYAQDPASTSNLRDAIGMAFGRYFNQRYQTYGRTIHILGFRGQGSGSTANQAHLSLIEDKKAFAVSAVGSLAKEAASKKMVGLSYEAFDRASYQSNAPRLISFRPDLEDEAAVAGDFVCKKLAGRPASFTGNPQDQNRTRVFGLLFQSSAVWAERVPTLEAALETRCGVKIKSRARIDTTQEAPTAIAQLRLDEVTTIISLTSNNLQASNAASAQSWYPEWFLPGCLTCDDAASHRLYNTAAWSRAFGLSFDVRREALDRQPWYLAYREVCPGCTSPFSDGEYASRLYNSMQLLFWGIQAAGPRLTHETMDKGLHAIPARRSDDPFLPAAYFGPTNYSFVKDAMETWWDPQGIAPGQAQPGCFRIPLSGKRFRAGDWDSTQTPFTQSPCQGWRRSEI